MFFFKFFFHFGWEAFYVFEISGFFLESATLPTLIPALFFIDVKIKSSNNTKKPPTTTVYLYKCPLSTKGRTSLCDAGATIPFSTQERLIPFWPQPKLSLPTQEVYHSRPKGESSAKTIPRIASTNRSKSLVTVYTLGVTRIPCKFSQLIPTT